MLALPVWFIGLWVGGLVLSILTRSLILCLGMAMLSICGGVWVVGIEGVSDIVRYGLMISFYGVAGFCVWQIIFKVRSL